MGGDLGKKSEQPKLPEVRQDLSLYPAELDINGSPQWHLHDPIVNQYYQLNEKDVQLLALFDKRTAKQVADFANTVFISETTEEEIEELVSFLRQNNLVVGDSAQLEFYQSQLDRVEGQQSWFATYIRKPLFFRYPLWNPDKFLDDTLPSLLWLGSRATLLVFCLITLLGIYLFSRQVDEFFATFLFFFSWYGAVIYVAALAFVKILHEFGHAYVAKALGCRVPVIGVALIMGWPILFTDTSDAWKIPDRKKRMAIGVAGVAVELAIASISLLLWSITPDGSIKSALFLLSSTTWILSIFVNFNPLMRFDGYYLLSDFLRMPNMESRSFNMAKWWMREKLFGFGISPTEHFRPLFAIYAYSVWVYRFFLFLGITFVIYSFFFKAAGLLLFVVTLIFFLVVPVVKEVIIWWELHDQIKMNKNTLRTLGCFLFLLGLVFIPWQTNVPAPAILEKQHSDLYTPEAGQILSLPSQYEVLESEILFELSSPQLNKDIEQATAHYNELRWTQSAQGFDSNLRSQARIVNSELLTQDQILRGLLAKSKQLVIQAPFTGELVDLAVDMQVGEWLPAGLKIATIVGYEGIEVSAYLPEVDLGRVELGMSAKFYPENIEFGVLDVFVKSIDLVSITEMDNLYLSSLFGGDIAVRETDSGAQPLVESHYKVELEVLDKDFSVNRVVRGHVIIEGQKESFFTQVKRKFIAVFLRETGF